jgi:hypothetical protein
MDAVSIEVMDKKTPLDGSVPLTIVQSEVAIQILFYEIFKAEKRADIASTRNLRAVCDFLVKKLGIVL